MKENTLRDVALSIDGTHEGFIKVVERDAEFRRRSWLEDEAVILGCEVWQVEKLVEIALHAQAAGFPDAYRALRGLVAAHASFSHLASMFAELADAVEEFVSLLRSGEWWAARHDEFPAPVQPDRAHCPSPHQRPRRVAGRNRWY